MSLLSLSSYPSIRHQQKNKIHDFHAKKNHYFHKLQEIGIVKKIPCNHYETFSFKCHKMPSKSHQSFKCFKCYKTNTTYFYTF